MDILMDLLIAELQDAITGVQDMERAQERYPSVDFGVLIDQAWEVFWELIERIEEESER